VQTEKMKENSEGHLSENKILI